MPSFVKPPTVRYRRRARVPTDAVASQSSESTVTQKEFPKPAQGKKSNSSNPPPLTLSLDGLSLSPASPPATSLLGSKNGPGTQQRSTDSRSDSKPDALLVPGPGLDAPPITTGLTNAIHPILARPRLTNIGDRYAIIEPALRLTTRFLGMDTVIKQIVVMADGELRRDTKPWGAGVKTDLAELADLKDAQGNPLEPNVGRYPKPHQEIVDEPMRLRAGQILEEAAKLMYITITDNNSFAGGTSRPWGFWKMLFPIAEIQRSCVISIGSRIIGRILKLSNRRQQGRSSTDVEWDLHIHQISLATTILHEIFHGLHLAHNPQPFGTPSPETFYGDCPLAECGFAGVAEVWGGRVPEAREYNPDLRLLLRSLLQEPQLPDPSMGFDGTCLELVSWPSRQLAERYEDIPSFGVREASKPFGALDVRTVFMSFVEDIFTDRYWDVEVPKLGQSPLRVPGEAIFPISRNTADQIVALEATVPAEEGEDEPDTWRYTRSLRATES